MTNYDAYCRIAEAAKMVDAYDWTLYDLETVTSKNELATARVVFEGCYNVERGVKYNPFVKKDAVKSLLESRINAREEERPSYTIAKVIFNPPATIVIWTDNTKTVVKTQNGERFDPEKGLAMAMVKKSMGNKGNYFNEIKKWTEEYSLKNSCVSIRDEAGVKVENVVDAIANEVLLKLKNTKI